MKKQKSNKNQLRLEKIKISRITNLRVVKGGLNSADCATPDDWTKPPKCGGE